MVRSRWMRPFRKTEEISNTFSFIPFLVQRSPRCQKSKSKICILQQTKQLSTKTFLCQIFSTSFVNVRKNSSKWISQQANVNKLWRTWFKSVASETFDPVVEIGFEMAYSTFPFAIIIFWSFYVTILLKSLYGINFITIIVKSFGIDEAIRTFLIFKCEVSKVSKGSSTIHWTRPIHNSPKWCKTLINVTNRNWSLEFTNKYPSRFASDGFLFSRLFINFLSSYFIFHH